jgi:hypothetical protein
MFWPGEMIRKSSKNNKHFVESKSEKDLGKFYKINFLQFKFLFIGIFYTRYTHRRNRR